MPQTLITVADLRAALAKHRDTDVVILSTDSEGNDFRALTQVMGHAVFVGHGRGRGDVHTSGDGVQCIVLWP